MNPILLQSFVYDTKKPGPRVLVLGAVHGNEICGPLGIRKFITELDQGLHEILNGRVTFIPVVNEKAYALNVRFVDENLNRNMTPHDHPQNYEQAIMPDLCRYLEDCDVLLDIHSASQPTPPFAFIHTTKNPHELTYAQNLGVEYAVTGWEDAYEKLDNQKLKASGGTTEYARTFGTTALTLECGAHDDPSAPDIAYQSIRACLHYFEMISDVPRISPSFTAYKLEQVFFKEKEGAHTQVWNNFDPITGGTVLARYADGEEIRAAHEGVILLPRPQSPIGEEWIYTATAVSVPG